VATCLHAFEHLKFNLLFCLPNKNKSIDVWMRIVDLEWGKTIDLPHKQEYLSEDEDEHMVV